MKKRTLFIAISPVLQLPRKRQEIDALWRLSEERWRRDKASRLKPADMLAADGGTARHLVTLRVPFVNFGCWPFWHHKEIQPEVELIRGVNIFSVGWSASFFVVAVPAFLGLFLGLVGLAVGALVGLLARVFLWNGRWGRFHVECKEGHLLLDYDVKENRWLHRPFRSFRDHVLPTEDPNVIIGKFCVVFRGRERFLFYFFLSRIKTPGTASDAETKTT